MHATKILIKINPYTETEINYYIANDNNYAKCIQTILTMKLHKIT